MVTIQEFDRLTFSEQADYTLIHGNFIMDRRFSNYRTDLYHLQHYFVEVLYNHVKNTIIGIISLPEKAVYQKYPDHISLEALF